MTNKFLQELKLTLIDALDAVPKSQYDILNDIHCVALHDLAELESQKTPHNTLKEFDLMGNGLALRRKMYTAMQDGVKKRRLYHNYLQLDDETANLYLEEAEYMANAPLNSFGNADALVFNIVSNYTSRYNPIGNYKRELTELWRSPKELIKLYATDRISDDCDGFGIFLFTLIDQALGFVFPQDRHRIKCHICDVKGELHFNLLWLRGGIINDWITIETTVWPDLNTTFWNNPARYQNYSKSVIVFDKVNEYKLLI